MIHLMTQRIFLRVIMLLASFIFALSGALASNLEISCIGTQFLSHPISSQEAPRWKSPRTRLVTATLKRTQRRPDIWAGTAVQIEQDGFVMRNLPIKYDQKWGKFWLSDPGSEAPMPVFTVGRRKDGLFDELFEVTSIQLSVHSINYLIHRYRCSFSCNGKRFNPTSCR